ncbi:phosphate translocator protein [Histomonas meleagridis]|uniref:phosphate translocator protein n=1 Tax=Histomonas meleagridis TaxID=135588 RepID=UPI00355A5DFE|nr:phosphate translocator protein [Histomonas meleagridis]KAH0799622.1 phosphate translocator protein [Histomonas meleagridis]
MCRMKLFPRATNIPSSARWGMACISVAGVVFMNFNLNMNSVGFYQLSKLCCIPFLVVYNFFFLGKTTPPKILFSLFILLVGISLFTVNDVQVNIPGSIIAVLAVISVSIQQTKMGTMQKEYQCNGPSVQHATAFEQFVICLFVACLIETSGKHNIISHQFQKSEIILIILTGIISCGVNVCSFGLIGKTSPITYQVVGHVKTILIFIFGLLMFPPDENETRAMFIKKVSGLIISMTGVILYTYFNLKDKEESTKEELETLLSGEEDQKEKSDYSEEESNEKEIDAKEDRGEEKSENNQV